MASKQATLPAMFSSYKARKEGMQTQTGRRAGRIDLAKEGERRRRRRGIGRCRSWTDVELLNHLFRRRDPE